jgi:mRNA interferase MazF
MVTSRTYQPERGDFIFLDFTPQAGTEQAGRRPALVLSPRSFNVATGLTVVCPVTNQMKGGAFEVAVPKDSKLTGVVLSDHLRSLDWLARRAEFHSKAGDEVTEEVAARVVAIVSAGV